MISLGSAEGDMTPHTLIANRFEILQFTSRGGMGTIYRARDRQNGAQVALKVLQTSDQVDHERFLREANCLAQLRGTRAECYPPRPQAREPVSA